MGPNSLPPDHSYIRGEIQQMADQLELERRLVGDATTRTLLREMWTVPGNRKRALISIFMMTCQQLTGVNAIVRLATNESLFLVTPRSNSLFLASQQNYYAPQIFQNMGMDGAQSSLFATGVYGIVCETPPVESRSVLGHLMMTRPPGQNRDLLLLPRLRRRQPGKTPLAALDQHRPVYFHVHRGDLHSCRPARRRRTGMAGCMKPFSESTLY